jgi:uncharacterized damage-inducible protein DinB
MPDSTIGEVLARQYDRVWNSLRDAVSKLSDQQWRTSDCDWLAPIRQAYHLVDTAEFYTRRSPKEGDDSLDWANGPIGQLPSQEQLLAFIDRVQPIVREWLTACGDGAFMSAEAEFHWTGGTRLDRAVYSLRHSQHHLGQINAELRRKGLPRGAWA